MTTPCRAEEGFSLVELLVSLAIVALMAIYGLSAYATMRDMNRMAERHEARLEVEQAAQYLRDEIGGTLAVLENDSGGQPVLVFEGEPQSLLLVAVSNGDRETGGLYRVRYFVNDKRELVSERQMYRPGEHLPGHTVVLLREVDALSFRYYDSKGQEQSAGWTNRLELPNAVTFAIQFGVEDLRRDVQSQVIVPSA
jgi:prepilin-type N-terminal cleavage/methylation domain-containing protein